MVNISLNISRLLKEINKLRKKKIYVDAKYKDKLYPIIIDIYIRILNKSQMIIMYKK